MCGIAGIVSLTERPPDPEWGAILTRALKHRGPDGDGVFSDSRVLLAHTRLAIIDRSEGGRQPMASGSGDHLLIVNGEIYNHAEIRLDLEREGVAFRSRSDTEVLVEALARWGAGALARVKGMFALARYDRRAGTILLARDRLGKKPLLYVRTPEWLAFASEAAALLRLPFVRPRLDPAALCSYARHLYVPAPASMIDGIRKLPPASTLEIPAGAPAGAREGRDPLEPRRYWSIPAWPNGAAVPPRNDEALDRELDDLLVDATRLRTVSDVPIGVFLSGGIDSNTVLSALHRAGHRPIRAFTVGFEGLPDERELARAGAARYADEHTVLDIRADVAEEVPRILRHFGEPLGDSAIVTTYLIAREASRHVTVILNGDGGDELFGGYARYPFARRLDLAATVPGGLRLARRLYAGRDYLDSFFDAVSKREYGRAARRLTSVMTSDQAAAIFTNGAGGAGPDGIGPVADDLTSALFSWDTNAYLPDDLLVKVDLASMAHGLENRSPFLDHRFFERVAPLPPSRRAHPFRTKPILRRLARGRVPDEILRAPKQGFQLPLERWLRGPLAGWLDSLLLDPQATGALYRPGALRSERDRFHSGAADPHAPYRLWGLATLELWAREFHVEIP
ncbi:MAG TPA: asparagine synthase (glutamine-hydrolyzing) [Candidatus Eisenbacteria bacterium]|nr:asparagine synthase (glutamine-hydrolyzing) [Candidatus Eisenbacteria bacterium]